MEKKKKSAAWRYFDDGPNKWEVKCLVCDDILRHHGNTTSLMRHLKAKHADEFKQCIDVRRFGLTTTTTDPASPSKIMKKVEFEFDVEDATQKLVTAGPSEDQNAMDPQTKRSSTTTEVVSSNSHYKFNQRKSPIWKFFESRCGRKEAICILCTSILRHHGNTTTLTRHLKAKHLAEAKSINIVGNSSIPTSNVTVNSSSTAFLTPKIGKSDEVFNKQMVPNAARHKLLNQKLLTMIIMDLQPLSFVDSKYFADVMKLAVADPRYSLPSTTTITTELLPNLYKETVHQVINRLEDIKHIAITTELWSHRHQESYLGVTAHFVCPEKWTLQSFMLSTTTFYGTPTGKHIASELERTIAEWNITDKVRVVVTDNETNTCLSNEPLPWAYIPCLAHLINIVVNDAISADDGTTALVDKVNGIVRYFKGDDDSKEKLAEVQKSLNLPVQTLVFDCIPSKWNGVYLMLEKVFEHIDAINAVLVTNEKQEMCLTSKDRDKLEMVIAALKPFEIATKTMSSENSMTISTAMPLVKGLMKMMSTSCNTAGGKEPLAIALRDGLIESFGKIEDIDWIVAAAVLDPRFKKCPYIEQEVIAKATQIITAEVSSICQETSSDNSTSKAEEDSLWMYLDVMMNSVPQDHKEQPPPAASLELRRYLDSPPVSREDNPLVFWRQHQELFPTLCQIAMKYMTVPISSLPCERLFTEAGDALAEKRSKLRAENMNMMLFLNNNLQHFGQV